MNFVPIIVIFWVVAFVLLLYIFSKPDKSIIKKYGKRITLKTQWYRVATCICNSYYPCPEKVSQKDMAPHQLLHPAMPEKTIESRLSNVL